VRGKVKSSTDVVSPAHARINRARLATSFTALAIAWLVCAVVDLGAQRGGRGGPPPTAKESAAIDLTGYWVSVITEDWKLRMVTPRKGAFDALPLNAEGRRVGNLWDPAKDDAAGEQCKAYGAGGVMRLPGRLRIAWQDDSTLRIETDAGTQTRLFRFGAAPASAGESSWQGQSAAEWVYAPARRGGGAGQARSGSLKVVTTNLRPGYVRKNGVPYSKDAVVTEYFDVNSLPNGEAWFTVTTRIDDPTYFARPYISTTDFKKLPDATGWNPTPCSAT
jgi:hypothetical protein